MDDVIMKEENNSKGEFGIKKITTHSFESRLRLFGFLTRNEGLYDLKL